MKNKLWFSIILLSILASCATGPTPTSPLLEMPGEVEMVNSKEDLPLNPPLNQLPAPQQVQEAKKDITRLMYGNEYQTAVYEDIIIDEYMMSYFENLQGRRRDYHTIHFNQITYLEIEQIPNSMKGRHYALNIYRPEGKNTLRIFLNSEEDIRELYESFQIMSVYARQEIQ